MKKSLVVCVLMLVNLLVMVGCAKEEKGELNYSYDADGIIFQANGSITQVTVASFEKEYYDADELKTMIENTIGDNQDVQVVSAEKKENMVYLQVNYASGDSFVEYEPEYVGVLNYEDAVVYNGAFSVLQKDKQVAGVDCSGFTYVDPDGETYDISKIKKVDNYNVAYINQSGTFQVEGYITCISSNIRLMDNNSVQIPDGEAGLIVYKNH
ncbi:MAG: hypothetical protein ACI4C1_09960 [Lachnospiraceae bacterium]